MRKGPFAAVALGMIFFLVWLFQIGALPEKNLQQIDGFAMDTYLSITLPDQLNGSQLRRIQNRLEEMDGFFNRYSAASDISTINREAGKWVPVSGDTFALLNQSLQIAEKTRGSFDPTIGPLVDLWSIGPAGTGEENWAPPRQEEIEKRLSLVGYDRLELAAGEDKVRLLQPGMSLDLGGIAKGYAVDRLVEMLQDFGIERALVDLGGNYYALGQHPEGRPWMLGIRHPRQAEEVIAVIQVEDQGVATSGDYQRYQVYQGQRFSHLLDPHTGFPARQLISTTIVAPSALLADALSTGIFILGPEEGSLLIEKWPGVEGVLIDPQLNIWYSTGLKGKVFSAKGDAIEPSLFFGK
jgi:thiamine biosynthesis lipoprotein